MNNKYKELLNGADDISLNNQLSELIVARFGSLKAFCDAAGMCYSTVHNILHRGTIGGASVNSVIAICDCLRIDFDSLARGFINPLSEIESPFDNLTVPTNVPDLFLSEKELQLVNAYKEASDEVRAIFDGIVQNYIHPEQKENIS